MITLADTLTPRHIALEPDVQDRAGAIEQTAALLRDDPRVVDWTISTLCFAAHSPAGVKMKTTSPSACRMRERTPSPRWL
jgi:hypothetical protein